MEKVATDVLHGVEQLVPRELALPAVKDMIKVVHSEIREGKATLKTLELTASNTRDVVQGLQVRHGGCRISAVFPVLLSLTPSI